MALELKRLGNKEKAAIMLLCLDEDTASDIFNHMNEDEVKDVGRALQSLANIPVHEVHAAMIEFYQNLAQTVSTEGASVPINGNRAAEKLLSKMLIAEREAPKLEAHHSFGGSPADAIPDLIKGFETKVFYEIIKEEHPQFVAILLSLASVKKVKELLTLFPAESRADIMGRVAKLGEVQESVLLQVQSFLESKRVESSKSTKKEEKRLSIGGIDRALKVLKAISPDQSGEILSGISEIDEELFGTLDRQMLTMEDLLRSDDVGIRELMRSVSTEDLKVALKDMPDPVKEKIFANMSSRAASILREDMEVMPAQKVEDVERAQKIIITEVKRLIAEGKIKLQSLDEDAA